MSGSRSACGRWWRRRRKIRKGVCERLVRWPAARRLPTTPWPTAGRPRRPRLPSNCWPPSRRIPATIAVLLELLRPAKVGAADAAWPKSIETRAASETERGIATQHPRRLRRRQSATVGQPAHGRRSKAICRHLSRSHKRPAWEYKATSETLVATLIAEIDKKLPPDLPSSDRNGKSWPSGRPTRQWPCSR